MFEVVITVILSNDHSVRPNGTHTEPIGRLSVGIERRSRKRLVAHHRDRCHA